MSFSPLTITLDRRLLEHPEALHLRRMRGAIWLYLALLARLPKGTDTLEVEPADLARTMGLPEGTIRSWLGHLRKHRYAEVRRLNGSVRVRLKHLVTGDRPAPVTADPAPARFFTVAKLEAALGETGNRDALEAALAAHPDPVIRRALAGALAVAASEIRRSRTALFLYLLKRHTHAQNDPHPRP
jgi:hypothetical protein